MVLQLTNGFNVDSFRHGLGGGVIERDGPLKSLLLDYLAALCVLELRVSVVRSHFFHLEYFYINIKV